MDHPERRVAVLHRVRNHAQCEQILNLLEGKVVGADLLVDRPQMLRPSGHVHEGNSRLGQHVHQRTPHLHDLPLPLPPALLNLLLQPVVFVGFEKLEGQVLQLPLDGRQPQAMGDGGIDVARLQRDSPLLGRPQVLERAHVVEPVGELDEDHPGILDHRHQQLAVVLDLPFRIRPEAHAPDLGHAVHDPRHLGAELGLHIGQVDGGVLHHIVDQARGYGSGIQTEFRQDGGDTDGVGDIACAGGAPLAGVCFGRDPVGPLDPADVQAVGIRLDGRSKMRGQFLNRVPGNRGRRSRHYRDPASETAVCGLVRATLDQ